MNMWGKKGLVPGFTVLEVIMAIAAMVVILLGVFQLPSFFSRQEKQLSTVISRDRIFKSFAQRFIQVAERADVAMRFQHLPVPVSCSGSAACVRTLENGQDLNPAVLSGLPTTIQFFNDEDGELSESLPFEGIDSLVVFKNRKRKPVNLDASVRQAENYVTWPLKDSTSPPFVLLTRSELNDYFFLVPQFVKRGLSTPWVIVEGVRSGVPVDQLLNRLMVVYNSNDLTQYFVQKVKSALDCSSSDPNVRAACLVAAQTIVPSFAGDPAFYTSRYYAFELQEVVANDLINFLPTLSGLTSSWGSQASSLFLFPTQNLSLFSSSTYASEPTTQARIEDIRKVPADAKDFGHFQDTLGNLRGNLVFLPVDLISYHLEDMLDGQGHKTGKMKLVMLTLGSNQKMSVLEDIKSLDDTVVKDPNSVVFVRRLGTTELGVFQRE